jgi:hypothetical protein
MLILHPKLKFQSHFSLFITANMFFYNIHKYDKKPLYCEHHRGYLKALTIESECTVDVK